MPSPEIKKLQQALARFSKERNWGAYHTPKNLAMALSVEASELAEIFQWLTSEESARVMKDGVNGEAVEQEMADVFLYLLRMADILGVDLLAAAEKKMVLNAKKYPPASTTKKPSYKKVSCPKLPK